MAPPLLAHDERTPTSRLRTACSPILQRLQAGLDSVRRRAGLEDLALPRSSPRGSQPLLRDGSHHAGGLPRSGGHRDARMLFRYAHPIRSGRRRLLDRAGAIATLASCSHWARSTSIANIPTWGENACGRVVYTWKRAAPEPPKTSANVTTPGEGSSASRHWRTSRK